MRYRSIPFLQVSFISTIVLLSMFKIRDQSAEISRFIVTRPIVTCCQACSLPSLLQGSTSVASAVIQRREHRKSLCMTLVNQWVSEGGASGLPTIQELNALRGKNICPRLITKKVFEYRKGRTLFTTMSILKIGGPSGLGNGEGALAGFHCSNLGDEIVVDF